MENIGLSERRRDPRTEVNLGLFVWSVETKGEHFLQEARARDISLSGALLSGIDTDVRPGDVVGILYLGVEARYRVVWVLYAQGNDKMQVAVQRIESDACPWLDRLDDKCRADAIRINAPAPESLS
jgi:PilZ domain-containing protein